MAESWLPPSWLDDLLNTVTAETLQGKGGINFMDITGTSNAQSVNMDLLLDAQAPGHTNSTGTKTHQQQKYAKQAETNGTQLTRRAKKYPIITAQSKELFQASQPKQASRIRSDAARRIEIAQLKLEVSKLEAHILYLTQKAVHRPGCWPTIDEHQLVNSKLRELAQRQQIWCTRVQSFVSHMSNKQTESMLGYMICLPQDEQGRVKALCDLKSDILQDGREILQERIRFLSDATPSFSHVSNYTTPEGDICASVFAAVPVNGTTGVKGVLDALRTILISERELFCEKSGTYTVKEAVDVHPALDQQGIAHRRSTHLTSQGFIIESKGVLFSEYRAPSGKNRTQVKNTSDEEATIVIHSIEDDQARPYANGRMRLDLSSIITIRWQKHVEAPRQRGEKSESIVITRLSFVKLRRSGVPISNTELEKAMEYALSKGPAAFDAAMEMIAHWQDCARKHSSSDTNASQHSPIPQEDQDLESWSSLMHVL